MKLLVGLILIVGAFAQQPVVTNVRNSGIGDSRFAPLSVVYIYGSFPGGQVKNFGITVGGIAGLVNVATNSYMEAVFPPNAPLGQQPLVVSFQGTNSSAFPVTLNQYAPEFDTTSAVNPGPNGPQFPLQPYYPISHFDGSPVSPASLAAPGEKLVCLVSGVGTTNPPLKLGGINAFESLAIQPVVMVGQTPAGILRAGSSSTSVEVDFDVPGNAPTGYAPVVLSINSVPSNSISIPIGTQPFITSVLNAASFRSPSTVAPGSIISIFGAGFGPSDNLLAFPKTVVNGTSVMFGATAAPVFALATLEGQINAVVPSELPTSGGVSLTVVSNSGSTNVFALTLAPYAPGIFYIQDPTISTRHSAAALLPNSAWLAMPQSTANALGIPTNCASLSPLSTCAQPATVGQVVQVFVTGMGKATPGGDPNGQMLATGKLAPPTGTLYQTVATPIVTVGGIPAKVLFSGIAPGFAGLYQINVQIPPGVQPGDDVPIQVSMPGSSTDTATIAVSQ